MLKRFVNMKLSKKLIIGFLIVALLAAIVGGVGIWNILLVTRESTELYEINTLSLQHIEDAARSFERMRFNVVKLALQSNAEGIADYTARTDERISEIEEALASYQTLLSEGDTASYNAALGHWNEYKTVRDRLVRLHNSYASMDQRLALVDEYKNTGDELRDVLLSMVQAEMDEAREKSVSNGVTATKAIFIECGVILVAVILAVLLGIYIAGITAKPINRAVEIAEGLAVGDMSAGAIMNEASLDRRDEVGILALSFRKLIDSTMEQVAATERLAKGDLTQDVTLRSSADILGKSLQAVIDNLNEVASSIIATANQVAAGASMISDSSMALSDGATKQASAVEELTASIEEVAAQTAKNAENANRANQVASDTKQTALKGNTQMDAMLKAMDDISASSANISKIIKVIDDIAFQTNILSLNAAVEAARAGQHGKGFAVVAEEVRTLAARSANAAKETTEMIEGSLRNIKAGIGIAQDTAGALNQIVTEIASVAELVEAIARACQEQSLGIENINQGIMQVSQVVQSNAASAEESAAASEELASQAQQLKEVVSVFETKHSAGLSLSEGVKPVKALPMASARISLEDSADKY